MKKFLGKKVIVVSSMLAVLSLTACSGDDALTKQPAATTAKFIQQASVSAEKALGLKASTYGWGYGSCIEGKSTTQNKCEALYGAMVTYANTTKGPFSHITVDELKNQTVYARIKNDYNRINVNTIPE